MAITPKHEQRSRAVTMRDLGTTINKLVAWKVYSPQEAVRQRGDMARLMKRRPKRMSHA